MAYSRWRGDLAPRGLRVFGRSVAALSLTMALTAAFAAPAWANDATLDEGFVTTETVVDDKPSMALAGDEAQTAAGMAAGDEAQEPSQTEPAEEQIEPQDGGALPSEGTKDSDAAGGDAADKEAAPAGTDASSDPAVDSDEQAGEAKATAAEQAELPEATSQQAAKADDAPAKQQVPTAVAPKAAAQAATTKLTAQATGGVALPAGAANVRNGIYVIETCVANNKVLGNNDKAPKASAAVRSWTYTGANGQKWEVVKDAASGWYHILACANKALCLGLNANNTVQLITAATSGDKGLWAFVSNGSWFDLVNRALTGQLLAVSKASGAKEGGNVVHVPKNATGGAYTRFYLLEAKPNVSPGAPGYSGSFSVIPATNTTLVAEVRGESKANNANVWLWTDKGREHQHIYFEPDGKGFYSVWIVGTGKVVSQESASICPGNNVVQKTFKANDDTQKWAMRIFADGTFSLVNKATGLALGVCGTTSGSNLVGTRNDGYKTTRFTMTRRPLLSAGIVELRPRTSAAVTMDVKGGVASGTAPLILWTRKNVLNQKFELVSAGGTDMWRIRTASSGGWICQSGSNILQAGNGSTARSNMATWMVCYSGGWYSFVNAATGKALDMRHGKTTNGTEIIAWSVNGRDSQHFSVVSSSLVNPGCYLLQNGGGRFLEAAGSSSGSDQNARVNAKGASAGQVFDIRAYGGDWTIKGVLSGRYLTASSTAIGANALLERRNTANKAQLWSFAIADGGRIAIKSVANPKLALDATDGGSYNGANVVAYTYRQQANQAWKPQAAFNDGTLSAKQKAVVSSCKSTPSPGQGWCAAWVTNVFENAGIGTWYGNACDHYDRYCKSSDLATIKPGMIIAVRTHPKSSAGSVYGHVGIYIGGGMMMDNVGPIRTISVLEWIAYYGDTCTPKWGWFGSKNLA